MLGKLFKHDFRALSRILFPLQIGVLAGGLVATLLTRIALVGEANMANSGTHLVSSGILMGASVLGAVLIGMAVAASGAVTLLMVCSHFYRSFLDDEGYLTFTLPVTTGQLLWSKLLTGLLWMLINSVVICVSVLIFAVFGTTAQTVMNQDVLTGVGELFRSLPEASGDVFNVPLLSVKLIVNGVLFAVAQLLEIYFAIIVGGQVAKKHRILSAIGMYLVINFVVGIIKNVYRVITFGSVALGSVTGFLSDVSAITSVGLVWNIVLYLGLAAGFFLWSRSILKNRLNLQ